MEEGVESIAKLGNMLGGGRNSAAFWRPDPWNKEAPAAANQLNLFTVPTPQCGMPGDLRPGFSQNRILDGIIEMILCPG